MGTRSSTNPVVGSWPSNALSTAWLYPGSTRPPFARRCVEVALADLARVRAGPDARVTFFDRGLVDGVTALRAAEPQADVPIDVELRGFDPTVFVVPPWREIYVNDEDRRHPFADAVAEHMRLVMAYTSLGYAVVEVPRLDVDARADFVERTLGTRR